MFGESRLGMIVAELAKAITEIDPIPVRRLQNSLDRGQRVQPRHHQFEPVTRGAQRRRPRGDMYLCAGYRQIVGATMDEFG